mmetsp:Transcript_20459/g.23169  ORF Transcript_20459/g.23169 Transcript_20459/m.23169 type:complete len:671 (+) Transcript_20459:83-2095(+)
MSDTTLLVSAKSISTMEHIEEIETCLKSEHPEILPCEDTSASGVPVLQHITCIGKQKHLDVNSRQENTMGPKASCRSSPTSIIPKTKEANVNESWRNADVMNVIHSSFNSTFSIDSGNGNSMIVDGSSLDQTLTNDNDITQKVDKSLNQTENSDMLADVLESISSLATEFFQPPHLKSADGYDENQNSSVTMVTKGVSNEEIPFDEGPEMKTATCKNNRKFQSSRSEQMSTMARMRYQAKNGQTHFDLPHSSNIKKRDNRTPEEIQKQKHQQWRNQIQASKLKRDKDDSSVNSILDEQQNPKRSYGYEVPNISLDLDDCGMLEMMATPFNAVVNQSQAMLLEAFVGKTRNPALERKDSYSSGGSDDDSESCISESSESRSSRSFDDDNYTDYSSDQSDHHDTSKRNRGKNNQHENVLRKSAASSKSRKHKSRKSKSDEAKGGIESEESEVEQGRNSHVDRSSIGLKNFLDIIASEGILLKWHIPVPTRSKENRKKSGAEVRVCIQISDSEEDMGGNEAVQPHFVWEEVREEKKGRFQDMSSLRHRLSLFDISSVQKAADSMNLQCFPYAVPENSVLITLNDGHIHLFEAEDEAEAKQVVHGLRWIEARLTFNLLVGNRKVCAEMLPMPNNQGENECSQILSSDIMLAVTDQLIDKSLKRLSKHPLTRKAV